MNEYTSPSIEVIGSLRDLTLQNPDSPGAGDPGNGNGNANGKTGGGGDGEGFLTLGKVRDGAGGLS